MSAVLSCQGCGPYLISWLASDTYCLLSQSFRLSSRQNCDSCPEGNRYGELRVKNIICKHSLTASVISSIILFQQLLSQQLLLLFCNVSSCRCSVYTLSDWPLITPVPDDLSVLLDSPRKLSFFLFFPPSWLLSEGNTLNSIQLSV